MACSLTSGRVEPCKDFVGGIQTLYLFDHQVGLIYTGAGTHAVTEVTANDASDPAIEAFQYDLRGASSMTTTINASRETGTVFYETATQVTLKGMDAAELTELELLCQGRPIGIVTDNNGNHFIIGHEFGCEVTGTMQTGAAMGDLSGFTLTLTSQERTPPLMVSDAAPSVLVTDSITNITIDGNQRDPQV